MMMHIPLLLVALQGAGSSPPPQDTILPEPDSAAMATAYDSPETRELVRLARRQRAGLDASVFHYTATSRQRISVGVRALRRDRLVYRREAASSIEWWRDRPSRVTVEGAREVIPVALDGVRVPDDIEDWAREFLPEPGDDRLWVTVSGDDGFAWHPLVENGESAYRYATGDTTVIRLPDGREYRLVELRVTPRERDIRWITGSFWIELDGHAIVQAVFRPSREFDLERDLPTLEEDADEDIDEIPGLLKPIRFDVRYITVEYGLWELRWWMPRLMAFSGHVQVGAARMPITLELLYSDYHVEADRYGLPELPPVIRELAGDTTVEPRPYAYDVDVIVPEDTASLLTSPLLAGSIFEQGETLISEGEIRQLADRLQGLPPTPWAVGRPRFTPPWSLGTGLLRYNRVEGLSAGARLDWDFARARLDVEARFGFADHEPRGQLGIEVPTLHRQWRVAGYHRLVSVDPALRPFGVANSLAALTFARDDGMYFGATGAEVVVTPAVGEGRYELRLYGERQRGVTAETDFSLFESGDGFRPNIEAWPADQVGIAARVDAHRGLDPTGFRWGGWLEARAETGDATFVRPGVGFYLTAPFPLSQLIAFEVASGTTFSDSLPAQSRWYLGGPPSLRGFAGASFAGPDYARARAEMASEFPAARLALFGDVGWAGDFESYDASQVAFSAGIGASFLDGLVRLDLARAIQPEEQWRLELYLDALF
jgi:hypothetical protein